MSATNVPDQPEPEGTNSPATPRRHIIILVHGIRDFALWESRIRLALEEEGFNVEATNYGRINLFEFLLPLPYFRKEAIKSIWDQIRIVKQHNDGALLSIIAHSFGTFVMAHLMKDLFDVKFHRIIFCGSTLGRGFAFENFQDRFTQPIINEVGTRDIWPAIAESVTFGYGSAGTYGFLRPLVRDRWHNGARRGYFLDPTFCKRFWVPFLRDGTIIPGSSTPETPRIWLQALSIFKLKYIAVTMLIFLLIYVPSKFSELETRGRFAVEDYVGQWRTNEANPRGITKLSVQGDGSDLSIHAWGACQPIDCDIGTAKATIYGSSVSSNLGRDVTSIEAVFLENWSEMRLTARLLSKTNLSVEVATRFTDGSGRADYRAIDVLAKNR